MRVPFIRFVHAAIPTDRAAPRRVGRLALVGACAVGFALITLPAGAETVLRTRLNSDIRSTEPGVNRDENSDAVMMHVFEGLVGFREDGSVGPLLADGVEVSADGLAYTFRLRDGVRFHNGHPLTSAEVAWSWKRYLEPKTQWRCLPDLDGHGVTRIAGIETPDAKTVVFRLAAPSALFLATMARPDCGGSAILDPESVDETGKWKAPISTGPFRLGTWKSGQYVELEKFADYASRPGERDGNTGGKKALVDRVRFMVIPDPSAAKAALFAGAIDAIFAVAPPERADLQDRTDITVDRAPTMDLYAILFQTRDPLLKDVRIRRAIALSIDYPALAEAVTHGASQANNSAVPPTSPYHGPVQAQGFPHDVAAARALLKEAGYAGQPIRLIANKRYVEMFDQAMLVQAMATEAGINLQVETVDWANELDRYAKGDYQMLSFAYSARLDPTLSFEVFTGPKATQPRKVWDDPEVQALFNASASTIARQERQKIFDDLHRAMISAVPLIPLFNTTVVAAVRKNVVGYRSWAALQPRFWNVSIAP